MAAVSASSGESPYSAHPIAMASGIETTGEVPGLQSVASARAAPAARSAAAGAALARRKNVEAGNKTAAVGASPPRAATPASEQWFR